MYTINHYYISGYKYMYIRSKPKEDKSRPCSSNNTANGLAIIKGSTN